MIVADSSAIAALILKEPGWEKLATRLSKAVSTELAVKEVINAVIIAWQQGRINKEELKLKLEALKLLIDKNIKIIPQTKLITEATEIAINNNITIYDAIFISLAKTQNLPLLTKDKKQHETATKLGIPTTLIK